MRIRATLAAVVACGLGLALVTTACTDQPTSPLDLGEEVPADASTRQAGDPAAEGRVGRLIAAIYPPGEMKRDANKVFSDIKKALARGDTDGARGRMVEFVDGLIEKVRADELQDPRGSQAVPSTTEDAAAELIRAYHQLVGLEPPAITGGIFEESGAAAVVRPDEQTEVKTGNGKGAVNVPPGAFDEPAFVALDRREDPASQARAPVPPTLDLAVHPPFYNVESTTQPAGNGDDVLVGICVPESGPLAPLPDLQDDLRVVRKAGDSSAPEVLPAANAGFVDCGPGEIAVAGKTSGFSSFAAGTSPDAEIVGNAPSLTCALRTDGQAFCWGRHDVYLGSGSDLFRLGNDTISSTYRTTPVPVMQGGVSYDTLVVGSDHVCALGASNGRAYCWGANGAGQLGTGDVASSATPREVAGSRSYESISAGFYSTCARTASETYCWGYNPYNQLGVDRSTTGFVAGTPQAITTSTSFRTVAVGGWSPTCGLTASDEAYCWGLNFRWAFGNDGTGTTPLGGTTHLPQPVAGGHTFEVIDAGDFYACGITAGGDTYCWGNNRAGGLGIGGSPAPRVASQPTLVSGGYAFSAVEANHHNHFESHTCAIEEGTGYAYCWGDNVEGQLGVSPGSSAGSCLGTSHPCSPTPLQVSSTLQFVDLGVAIGEDPNRAAPAHAAHTCGVTTDGEVWCWGDNSYGQLGDGSTTDSSSPVQVTG